MSGCGNGYRILEWIQDMEVSMGFVNVYRKMEWVKDVGMGKGCLNGFRIWKRV